MVVLVHSGLQRRKQSAFFRHRVAFVHDSFVLVFVPAFLSMFPFVSNLVPVLNFVCQVGLVPACTADLFKDLGGLGVPLIEVQQDPMPYLGGARVQLEDSKFLCRLNTVGEVALALFVVHDEELGNIFFLVIVRACSIRKRDVIEESQSQIECFLTLQLSHERVRVRVETRERPSASTYRQSECRFLRARACAREREVE